MRNRAASDDELMQAIARGDDSAFSELTLRHRRWVGGLVRAFVHEHDQAEDVTQEVFCRVHRRAGAYNAQGSFIPWLKRVAVNCAKDFLRQQRQAELIPLHTLEETAELHVPFDPTAALMTEGLRDDLRTVIQALPEDQRLTLIMRYFGDMSLQDIAWAMRCPEGTVKSRVFHGLRRVRELLAAHWEQEGDDHYDR